MQKFVVNWRHGDPEIVEGNSIADAMTRSGYGGNIAQAVESWEPFQPSFEAFKKAEKPTGLRDLSVCQISLTGCNGDYHAEYEYRTLSRHNKTTPTNAWDMRLIGKCDGTCKGSQNVGSFMM